MAVGAQNDLGGGANFCPKNDLMHCVSLSKLRRFFSAQIEVFSKKKRSSLKFERFFCPNEGVLQKKKKKKRSAPKLRRYFGNGVPKYPDYLTK